MAESSARSGLTPQKWDSDYFLEYTRKNRLKPYMGKSPTNVIVTKEDISKGSGDKVTFAAVRALSGGVTGNTVLEGNEAELDMRSMAVTIRPLRNAVIVTDWDEQKSAIDIRDAARPGLMTWSMEKLREDMLVSLKSMPNASGVMTPYESLTAAERNTFLTNNADRVLFGSAVANGSSNVWATALATVDNTADKLTTSLISLAKRRAQMATPRITPFMTKDGDQEWYVLFTNPLSFRDLQQDTAMVAANRDARVRGVDSNPLFTGGELVWDGVIIKEIPEMSTAVSASSTRLGQSGGIFSNGTINVGFSFLCGASAIGAAWAQRTKSTTDTRDYQFRHGVGIQEMRGIEKLMFGTSEAGDTTNLVQNGVVTIVTAAVADA